MGRVADSWDDWGAVEPEPSRPVVEEKPKPYTVSGAMQAAKAALEGVHIRLVGEVSELSNKPGYKAVYFTVKDEKSSLPCMMWVNKYNACGVELRIGQLIELAGRFTLYPAKGRMNFDVFSIKLAGEGDLRMKIAQLARKLDGEGLMAPERKRALPELPEVVGLVTSPRGDAVHDVLRTLRRRYPLARVLLAGVPVEGATAPAGIARGIQCVANAGAQVVLVVRGGGSFEDLMPFNDEGLARAIAACPVPVVTGIGHEPDTTIADLVADRRASTPTAAAEAVAPDRADLLAALDGRATRMHDGLSRRLERSALVLQRYADRPLMKDPMYLYASEFQALDSARDRLTRALPQMVSANQAMVAAKSQRLRGALPLALSRDRAKVQLAQQKLASAGANLVPGFASQVALGAARLQDLSPLNVLARGYAIARDDSGKVVSSVETVSVGQSLSISVSDGHINAQVTDVVPLNQ